MQTTLATDGLVPVFATVLANRVVAEAATPRAELDRRWRERGARCPVFALRPAHVAG